MVYGGIATSLWNHGGNGQILRYLDRIAMILCYFCTNYLLSNVKSHFHKNLSYYLINCACATYLSAKFLIKKKYKILEDIRDKIEEKEESHFFQKISVHQQRHKFNYNIKKDDGTLYKKIYHFDKSHPFIVDVPHMGAHFLSFLSNFVLMHYFNTSFHQYQ
ncbi:hypothetical protein PPERSA_07193 [Pseudocohnilembus persalinus]|uniref:Uncharacterized protein n=1 Tax=Pseudocohnilembus persalinus TaxID=266149 RepID=A0A0V0QXS4_PSEPJ|nr:hypothetical protein PPERSA_07193 [Pseudocohnilembus persalinus]|eukprot:KRX07030.1 hypothetical protein PPERSA_07193 [Pseudocohnilembus persalinus]